MSEKTLNEKDLDNVAGGRKFAKYVCNTCWDHIVEHHWKADFKNSGSTHSTQVIICDSCHDKLINDNKFSNWIECDN